MKHDRELDDKQFLFSIFMKKRGRESILREYGEKGFDTFTGYIDWDFLELNMIVEKELKFLEKAQLILSDQASEEQLKTYGLKEKNDYYEKIGLLTDNLQKKLESNDLIQKYPEVEILFSIVSIMYLEYYDFERREFKDKYHKNLVIEILRTLVQFYSNLKQRGDIIDRQNILGRKLIILTSILDDLTFCYDFEGVPSGELLEECKLVINVRIIRATMMDEIYKRKKKTANKSKLKNLCREIIADLERVLYLQWILNYNEVEPILNILIKKIELYIKEGIDLPYEKIIKQTKEHFPPIYLRNEDREGEKRNKFIERINQLDEILKEYHWRKRKE